MDLNSLSRVFPEAVRRAGEALERQGRVELIAVEPQRAAAAVREGGGQECSLDVTRGAIHAYCSCPAGERRSPCAHLWATAVAAHGEGFLPSPWRRQLDLLNLVPPEPKPVKGRLQYVIDQEASLNEEALALTVQLTSIKKDGKLGHTRPVYVPPASVPTLADADDRRIHVLLHGASADTPGPYGTPWPGDSTFVVPPALAAELVPLLCGTGRFLDGGKPLAYSPDPWILKLRVVPRGHTLQVTAAWRRGEAERPFEAHQAVPGWLIGEGQIAPADDGGLFAWLETMGPDGLSVPAGEADALLRGLARRHLRRLELPPELELTRLEVHPRPRLRVERWRPTRLGARLSFDYGEHSVPAEEPAATLLLEGRRVLERDLAAEEAATAQARAAGLLRTRAGEGPSFCLPPAKLARVVQALSAQGWLVEAEGRLHRPAGAVRLHVSSGTDWFDLAGEVDFGDQSAELPAIVAAVRRGERTVRLGDGSFGVLPEDWLQRYRLLLDAGEAVKTGLRFQRPQAALLDALLAEQGEVDVDAAFARARAALAGVDLQAPAEAPAGFRGTLRPYQKDGLAWLRFLAETGLGGCLADDMGLGKTVQVLAHLASRPRAGLSLVVAPRSLVFNWVDEAARFTPGLRVADHTGPQRARTAEALPACDVLVTTYGVLRRDITWLKDVAFGHVVLDEAQAIKNADSDSAKAARLLRADHRLALSGTPIENRIDDLWSLFEFLNPGMLGRARAFSASDLFGARSEESRRVLARALRPFLLRRTKGQVARDLPERVEQTLHVELGPEQRAAYDALRDHYRRSLLAQTAKKGVKKSLFLVLEALLRLRQAACHPSLVDPRSEDFSAKLDALLPLLEEVVAEGSKALVFSQFTSFLALLRPRLEQAGIPYEYLDGSTTDRAERVGRFQEAPGGRAFLISLKAGGLGLNLTAAEYVFLLDPWWNPAVEAQAIDRAHRIGQSRTVFAYRLVARDTIEEKVLALQQSKRELAEAVIQADESFLTRLDQAELEQLLS